MRYDVFMKNDRRPEVRPENYLRSGSGQPQGAISVRRANTSLGSTRSFPFDSSHLALLRSRTMTDMRRVGRPHRRSDVQYTVSSRGRPIGVTDLGFVPLSRRWRFGWFHPNSRGQEVLSMIVPVPGMPAHLQGNALSENGSGFAHPDVIRAACFKALVDVRARSSARSYAAPRGWDPPREVEHRHSRHGATPRAARSPFDG